MPVPKLSPEQVDDVVAFLWQDAPAGILPPWQPAPDLNVTFARLKQASNEPHNWLTYWGNYRGTHFTRAHLDHAVQRRRARAARGPTSSGGTRNETSPIVVDGLMFVTGPLNDAAALDARTGSTVWRYRAPGPGRRAQLLHRHDESRLRHPRRPPLSWRRSTRTWWRSTPRPADRIWDVPVDDYQKGFSITHAPLAIDGKIIVGVTAGECGLNGFVDAYDAATGKKLWRFWAVPAEGRSGACAGARHLVRQLGGYRAARPPG